MSVRFTNDNSPCGYKNRDLPSANVKWILTATAAAVRSNYRWTLRSSAKVSSRPRPHATVKAKLCSNTRDWLEIDLKNDGLVNDIFVYNWPAIHVIINKKFHWPLHHFQVDFFIFRSISSQRFTFGPSGLPPPPQCNPELENTCLL